MYPSALSFAVYGPNCGNWLAWGVHVDGKICGGDNRVVFDDETVSYIEHKQTGRKTPLTKKGGVYVMEM